MSKVVPRYGAPIGEQIDDATRQQLEAFRDQLAKAERSQALERPRDDAGRYAQVPRDTLVRDNKTLQRMRDVTAAVGDQTVGWLLDKAQVPSVTQLTKRYSTQASRAPLLGMLVGKGLGPTEAAVLGTSPRLGTGGALVPWKPSLPAVIPEAPRPAVAAQAQLQIEYKPAEDVGGAQQSARAKASETKKRPTWWDSLKAFGKSLVDTAKSAWTQLKTHPLVASAMSLFVGKGYGPAHASMQGANPPKQPTPGAPMDVIYGEAPLVDPAADFGGAVTNLAKMWPEGVKVAPAPFTAQAEALQAFKQDSLQKLGETPAPKDVRAFLDRCDEMHGRPGHSQNVARLADAFFADDKIRSTLARAPGFSARVSDQVRAAAPWLALGDVATPVATLAGRDPLSGGEVRAHLVPRGARAAALFETLQLGGGKTAALLEGYREADPERPIASQLVRLLDDTAALAASPACRAGEAVDPKALGQRLQAHAAEGAFHPDLADLMTDAAQRGLIADALRHASA